MTYSIQCGVSYVQLFRIILMASFRRAGLCPSCKICIGLWLLSLLCSESSCYRRPRHDMQLNGKQFWIVSPHGLFLLPTFTGLKILRVINEPTAAAMAYGLHKVEVFHVLVIDLGGGTLDVSLLNKQGGMFLTRAMSGKKTMELSSANNTFLSISNM